MSEQPNKIALVTGASRGVGAAVAKLLGQSGVDVAINYRNKASRAEAVAAEVRAAGSRAWTYQADLTDPFAVEAMVSDILQDAGHLNYLILNASGGLEKDRPADYSLCLNRDAQTALVDATLPLLASSGRIVFVTSHLAHFYGERPVYDAYEPVAAGKHAGEMALRSRIAELEKQGVTLAVVSGDMIEGTITPRLMERSAPGLIESRRARTGSLPTIEEFAAAIVKTALDPDIEMGDTVFVGETE